MLTQFLGSSQPSPATALTEGSWFEILLFDIKLRFTLPKLPTAKPDKNTFNAVDQRPFVNTIAKQRYLREDELEHYAITMFSQTWQLSPPGLFSKSDAALTLCLSGISATEPQMREGLNLTDQAACKHWIDQHNTGQAAFFGSFFLQQQDNGYYKMVDTPSDEPDAITPQHNCTPINLNGHPAFNASTAPNHQEYWIPFSPSDLLNFTFTISLKRPVSDTRKREIIIFCTALVQGMMSSVTLTYPSHKLSRR
jgi:hypothetical protein